jgi:hypothetical protein
MPVKVLNRPKVVKQGPNDSKNDPFNFVKQSDRKLFETFVDLTWEFLELSSLDDDLSRCLEDLSLQLQDEDFRYVHFWSLNSFF